VNVSINARHMDVTAAIRAYVDEKTRKLPRYYDGITEVEVVLAPEAEHHVTEIVARGGRKHTFVASHRAPDLYASLDGCIDKIAQQLRRHKDRVRDRKGPSHPSAQGGSV